MKKSAIIVSGILVIAAAAGGVYWYHFQDHPFEFRENLSQLVEGFTETESDPVYVTAVSTIMGTNAGVVNRYAGVVEPQNTVEVKIESNRLVKDVYVKVGDVVKQGQLLFEYDLSNIQDQLQEENLNMERLKNEAMSLQEQIDTLEKEKKKASKDNQLSYTIEIETNKMNLKKNEYDQKSQQAKIDRLQNATGNTEVRSEIDGVIQKIDLSKMPTDSDASVTDSLDDTGGYSMMDSDSDSSGAFITILSTGAYREKGKINELNMSEIVTGEPVIIRSRMDESLTWDGTMGMIDRDNANKDNNENMYFGMSSSDNQTNSSTYPFYVELESSDGLMLGQHVYIEPDNGQDEKKEGIWLSDIYLVDIDTAKPYVWAADARNRLEKRTVVLGEYDETLGEYRILEGLSDKDYITYPSDGLEEGLRTVISETPVFEDYGVDSDMDSEDMDFSEDGFGMQIYDEDDLDAADSFSDYPDDADWEEEDWSEEDWEDDEAYDEDFPEDGEIVESFYIDENGNEIPLAEGEEPPEIPDDVFEEIPEDEENP